MPDVLVRGLDQSTVDNLKSRAKRNGRSLQSELRVILQGLSGLTAEPEETRFERAQRIRGQIKTPQRSDSTDLIREDRER